MLRYEIISQHPITKRLKEEALYFETSNDYGFNRAKKLARDITFYRGFATFVWSQKSDAHDKELELLFQSYKAA